MCRLLNRAVPPGGGGAGRGGAPGGGGSWHGGGAPGGGSWHGGGTPGGGSWHGGGNWQGGHNWHGGGSWRGGYYGGYYGGGYYGGYWGPGVGVYLGGPWYWGAWPYAWYDAYPYTYGYRYAPYPVYVPQDSAYVEQVPSPAEPQTQSAAPGPTNYWYYCTDPAGYYPYVQSCTKAWMQVVPQSVPAPK